MKSFPTTSSESSAKIDLWKAIRVIILFALPIAAALHYFILPCLSTFFPFEQNLTVVLSLCLAAVAAFPAIIYYIPQIYNSFISKLIVVLISLLCVLLGYFSYQENLYIQHLITQRAKLQQDIADLELEILGEKVREAYHRDSPPPTSTELKQDSGEQKYYGDGPNGEGVKGHIGKNGKIYHVPGSTYYNRTKRVSEWFFTEEEAQNAGYRPPLK